MKKEIPNPYQDRQCFYCGSENPRGFKLKFFLDPETGEVFTEYVPSPPFTGQGNILHGGIQMGLIDEVMGWTAHVTTGEMCVTTNIEVRFLKPVYMGKEVKVVCRATSREGPYVHMDTRIEYKDGTVCTTATGTYHLLSDERYQVLIQGE